MIKAVIFDFNGTLFKDGAIHEKIWSDVCSELAQRKVDKSEFKDLFGAINRDFINNIITNLNINIPLKKIDQISEYKEKLYRDYVLKHKLNKLTDGAIELFKYLKSKKIKFNLCSASIENNVKFFFEEFGLKEYFNFKEAVFDNGSFKNKKEMFLKSIEILGVEAEEVLVFEDSNNGVKSASEAGIKNIVLINNDMIIENKNIIQRINNFNEFDRRIL